MAIKIVMGTKSGKCYQKELESAQAEALYGRVLGEEVHGEAIGISGVTFQITGGSDDSGFPMRKDLPGIGKKKIFTAKGIGFKGKHRGQRFGGIRVKKTVAGNTVSNKTHQLNLKVIKGDEVLAQMFPATEKKEEKKE